MLRSPHAHAQILHIDAAATRAAAGVPAVLTAADLERDGIKPIPTFTRLPTSSFPNRDGTPLPDPPYLMRAARTAAVVKLTAEVQKMAGELYARRMQVRR